MSTVVRVETKTEVHPTSRKAQENVPEVVIRDLPALRPGRQRCTSPYVNVKINSYVVIRD